MGEAKSKSKVRIVFKSGYAQDLEGDDFVVTQAGGRVTEFKWRNVDIAPVYVDFAEVAAVFFL